MMQNLERLKRIWDHVFWADEKLLRGISSGDAVPEDAVREYAHIIGTEEVWLARLERRDPLLAIWPDLSSSEMEPNVRQTHDRWTTFLSGLRASTIQRSVAYTNSAGQAFENSVGDILDHVALHGHYHRGKVNLMLRQAGVAPVPVDYIAFVRGAPAATEGDPRRRGA